MNQAHLHLLLNHIPIVGTIFCLLLLLIALLRKSDELKRVSLGGLVLVSLLTIPAYLTGEPAEKVVEHLPGVSEALIEPHEKAAFIAFLVLLVTGAVSLIGLIWSRRRTVLPGAVVTVALLLTAVTAGLMAYTANLGGQIRHTEIRAGANSATQSGESGSNNEKKQDDDERREHR